MCLNNCNIEVEENKDKKINCDLTYEDRLKIEDMIRSRIKYTIQEIADKIGRNKSIVSREIKRNGYETIIVNNNPETVSTDFDIADRLYF